jgi:hypothetical protein
LASTKLWTGNSVIPICQMPYCGSRVGHEIPCLVNVESSVIPWALSAGNRTMLRYA